MSTLKNNPLKKQLDNQKFLHAVAYVRKEALGLKTLTTAELAGINQLLCGKAHDEDFDPWRVQPTVVKIPSGQEQHFNLLSNPVNRARDLIGQAQSMVGNQQGFEAFFYLYTQMVLEHLFKEANRRTAVAAALWMLLHSDHDCDAEKFLTLPVGDLRKASELESLRKSMKSIVQRRA